MNQYDVAVVGTDAEPGARSPLGTEPSPDRAPVDAAGTAHRHAAAYRKHGGCTLVACTDLVRAHAEAFADAHCIPYAAIFEDYREMLEAAAPDVVSVCTPPSTRAEIVIGAAESGVPEAIHCETPMAMTWGDARRMAAACDRAGVALTVDHTRRLGDPFRDAKALLDDGAIGTLQRIEYNWRTFYDNGTDAIDACHYFNDDRPAEWVLGQLDYREAEDTFGARDENQLLATWQYDNGVYGVAVPGPTGSINAGDWRLVGEEGFIDVHLTDDVAVRVRGANGNTEKQYEGLARGETCVDRAIADVIDALDAGRPSALEAGNALDATEIVFAGYESVRRRGRVDLPLDIEDNPLESMVDAGTLDPQPSDD